jgi:hypothetical protein
LVFATIWQLSHALVLFVSLVVQYLHHAPSALAGRKSVSNPL